jgi:transposase InsO family protein
MTDSKTVYITFVLDNYSKMILGFAVAEKLSFALVKRALKSSLQTIYKQTSRSQSYLVTDGGRENHNSQIDKFLDSLAGNRMIKVRAIKDIQFSNNPVEAIHKIMKGRYLRNRRFPSISKLEQFLKWAVHDYNSVRPHTRHWPRTPEEVYFQKPLNFDPHLRIREGQKRRIKEHLTRCCEKCSLPIGLSNGTA